MIEIPTRRAREPTRFSRLPRMAVLLAATACAPAAERGPEQQQQAAALAACRREAERVINYRDRGQLMRSDDQEARVGVSTYLSFRPTADRLAATYERDQLAARCVRGADPSTTPVTGGLLQPGG